MPRDDDQSLGDEATLQGGKPAPADERSLGDRSTFGGSDGSSLSDPGEFAELPDHDMEIVDLSSRYKIAKILGKGGMGEVLLATDIRLDRKVAIKRIRRDAGSSKPAVARFLTEAKSVAALNHHNVVQIHDYGHDQDGPFLIMEYVPGGTLLDRCKRGPIELEEAIDLACQLCDGLGRAHEAGIIHRDIKPANILLTNDGVPKLTDFGLAKADSRDHTMTMAGTVLGTLEFMPPEQRQDASRVDERSDLWSLGATLYQMVTGKSPRIIKLNEVPKTLHDLLERALEDEQENRHQNAQEFRNALIDCKSPQLHAAPKSQHLGDGECPECHTLNDTNRKFCRECAQPLILPCLQCSEPMPIWDKVCGDCGGKQQDLLDEARALIETKKQHCVELLDSNQYEQAISLADEIGTVLNPRLKGLRDWADEFITEVSTTKKRQIQQAADLFLEAIRHRNCFDDERGIAILGRVPDVLRHETLPGQDGTVAYLLAELESRQQKVKTLEEQIRVCVKQKQYAELPPLLDQLMEFRPEHQGAKKLKRQLRLRTEKQKERATQQFHLAVDQFEQKDYARCLETLGEIKPTLISDRELQLKNKAKLELHRVQRVEKALLEGDYLAVLQIDPGNAHALSMKREADLQLALLNGDYSTALRLDPSNAHALSMKREADLQLALLNGDYSTALRLDPSNAVALSLKKKAANIQQALSNGDYAAALQLDPSNTEALSMKKKAIQQALASGDYAAALQFDPSNFEALSMKKAADIQQALSNGDYAAALQLDPSNTEALSMKWADAANVLPITNSIGMELKRLPAGVFTIFDQHDGHEVTITKPFMLGVHEVTQEQYTQVMDVNPSDFKGTDNPVENVSWIDAVSFCCKLSELPAEKAAGRVYRLPTEAEWEYACRAGTTTQYSFGDNESDLQDYAWYRGNSHNSTHPVGGKHPNSWGFYDMHGNIWEWVQDYFDEYTSRTVTDPKGPVTGSFRVLRGGSWNLDAQSSRSESRDKGFPSLRSNDRGFRVCLSLSGK